MGQTVMERCPQCTGGRRLPDGPCPRCKNTGKVPVKMSSGSYPHGRRNQR